MAGGEGEGMVYADGVEMGDSRGDGITQNFETCSWPAEGLGSGSWAWDWISIGTDAERE